MAVSDISFKLDDYHKLILVTIRALNSVKIRNLWDIVRRLEGANENFDTYIQKILIEQTEDPVVGFVSRLTKGNTKLKFRETLISFTVLGLVQVVSGARQALTDVNSFDSVTIGLTKEGERIAQALVDDRHVVLRPAVKERSTIFVACAFGRDDIDLLHKEVLSPAISLLNYRVKRVDSSEPRNTITNEILTGITECACVVADLTYARQSVYFEVGFAQGLGIPIILTCRKDHMLGSEDKLKVHFDLVQYKISFWEKTNNQFSWSPDMNPEFRLKAILKELPK